MKENGAQKEDCTQERGKVNKNCVKIKAEFKFIKKKVKRDDLLWLRSQNTTAIS